MIKLLSVNIEMDKHVDAIKGLLEKVQPDVVCMQECPEKCVEEFSTLIGGTAYFAPMHYKDASDIANTKEGIALFSKLSVKNQEEFYYFKSREEIGLYEQDVVEINSMVLLSVVVEKDGEDFSMLTTHFSKSQRGEADDFQRSNIPKLMDALSKHDEFVLCGDFNAPRGMEIFSTIAAKYKDNINPKYKQSLDPNIHRAGNLPYMVDGLFTTPHYNVTKMHFETGVSDHYAIVAEIEKAK